MFGIDDAILGGALSFGGKLLSGLGATNAAKSQQRRAAAETYMQNQNNSFLGAQVKNFADSLATAGNAAVEQYRQDTAAFDPIKDAQTYGFNPVTWINSGLATRKDTIGATALSAQLQNYQSYFSNWIVGEQMQMPGKTEAINIPSPMSAFGDAISAATSSYTQASQFAKELDVKQASLGILLDGVAKARANGNAMAGLGTPFFTMSGPVRTGGGAAAALSLGGKSPPELIGASGYKSKPGEFTSTGLAQGDPNWPDSNTVMSRYGMIAGEASGLTNLAVDAYRRYFGPAAPAPLTDRGWGFGRTDQYGRATPNVAGTTPSWMDWLQQAPAQRPGALSPYIPDPLYD